MIHPISPIRSASFDQIRNLSRSLRSFQEYAVASSQITFNQFAILDFAFQENPLPLKNLHDLLGVEKSTSSRLIKPLITRQYLEKTINIHDKRSFDLYITEAGEEIYNKAWDSLSEAIDTFFSTIPKSEQLRIASSIQVISQAFFNCSKQ